MCVNVRTQKRVSGNQPQLTYLSTCGEVLGHNNSSAPPLYSGLA